MGSREYSEAQGQRSIRDYMPDQHRSFFSLLAYIFLSAVDKQGWPVAAMLSGPPGFAFSPDPHTLRLHASFAPNDPAASTFQLGAHVGILGLDLATRRRNRMNGHIMTVDAEGLTVAVDQSFGNCPQYIQRRAYAFPSPQTDIRPSNVDRLTGVDDHARHLIEAADTFFVASANVNRGGKAMDGCDMSHRGGKPGFVKVDKNQLTIPDFKGNAFFNTLGNLLVNPKAGLLFLDFANSDLLYLAGKTEIVWEGPELKAWVGAERLWKVTISHGWRLQNALPFRWTFQDCAPTTELTAAWADTKLALEEGAGRDIYWPHRVERIVEETTTVRSIYLERADGKPRFRYKPGQFLPIRTISDGTSTSLAGVYTISTPPQADRLRLSIKRGNTLSRYAHEHLKVGDVVEALEPRGDFFLDHYRNKPAAFISAGIGITPMMSMLGYLVTEGKRTGRMNGVLFAHATGDLSDRPFLADLREAEGQSRGQLRLHLALTRGTADDARASGFDQHGRLTADGLFGLLPSEDCDIYLCGPGGFMQDLYNGFRALGIADDRIYAEAFGPSSLRRDDARAFDDAPGGDVDIVFARTGIRAAWRREASSLLQLGGNLGVALDSSCRRGACASCAVRVVSGDVRYQVQPLAPIEPGTALLCCARPSLPPVGQRVELVLDA
jgi:ferredoxin-NADP reductase/predicted pyridoxine 5'-phosphate oxidase superfamily flavin-nucleotide-binding protein